MNNKIKEIIKERNISQKRLSEMTGMSEAGLSGAINGSATQDTINKIAAALNVSPQDLVDTNELYAKYSAEKTPLKLGEVEIPCYVLNNGLRVLSGRGIQKVFGGNSNQSGSWLSKYVNNDSIAAYLTPGILDKFNSPIKFKRKGAGGSQSTTNGYEATLLIDFCTAIIDSYEVRSGVVNEDYYKIANIIVRAVAKVGIIALVDEATGYNKEKTRAKDELQKFLATFISKEAEQWVKMFDDTFFEDIYKMHNWTWEKTTRHPSYVGKIINDIVYERIAPTILTKLRELNPKFDNGNRKYKHHQFLTSEVGRPMLQQHLAILHTLAVASNYKWGQFMYMLDKTHPKQYQQLLLFDDYYE